MRCQACGNEAPTHHIAYYQIVGLLIAHQVSWIKGELCRPCINRYFWKFSATTFFLGWWGVRSFFLTPLILLHNLGRYLVCAFGGPIKEPPPWVPPRCPHCTRPDPDLFHRGYCLGCKNDC